MLHELPDTPIGCMVTCTYPDNNSENIARIMGVKDSIFHHNTKSQSQLLCLDLLAIAQKI